MALIGKVVSVDDAGNMNVEMSGGLAGWAVGPLESAGGPASPGDRVVIEPIDDAPGEFVVIGVLGGPGGSGSRGLDIQQPSGRDGLVITGNSDPVLSKLLSLRDRNGVPIAWVANAGGLGVTDNIFTTYDFYSTGFYADVWGNVRIGEVNLSAGDGPPGNMLDFTTACMEQFQLDRFQTISNWSPLNCDVDSIKPTVPPPTKLRWALEMTSTTLGSQRVSSPGFPYDVPVIAEQQYSAVGSFLAATDPDTCQVLFSWFDIAGTFISDTFGTAVPDDPAVWTKATVTATAPTGATTCTMSGQANSTSFERKHLFTAAGIYKGDNLIWSPPQVAQMVGDVQWVGAKVGDLRIRKDTPTISGQRLYICTAAGYPNQQEWLGIL